MSDQYPVQRGMFNDCIDDGHDAAAMAAKNMGDAGVDEALGDKGRSLDEDHRRARQRPYLLARRVVPLLKLVDLI